VTSSIFTHLPTAHAAIGGFVTRSGSQLQLNGNTFRFSGTNIYWMTLDENVGGVNYPTSFRVDDAFATAQEMGATVVRSVNGASSVGCSLCLEPSLGSFNADTFQHLDYAIKSAGDHGIRLILPLVDNWHYYGGGKHTYTDWRGLSNEDDFYSNTTVIGDFEQFISTVLNHVNSYTGVAYKNDPTIMAWEEGNELQDAPASWVSTIANYVKGIDSNHLLSFSYGIGIGSSPNIQQDTLSIPNIDIEDAHFYPMSVANLNSGASLVQSAGKVYYAGEYDWPNYNGGDSLGSFLSAIEANGTANDTFWSLFPHNDTYGYVQHGDGYTLHYPGDTSDMRSRAQALRTHAYTMSGRSVPADGTPAAPVITSINGQAIAWRGSTPSDTYSVERSTAGNTGPWTVICDRCATDNNTPWTDSSQPSGTVWYRVRGFNLSSVPGDYSPVSSNAMIVDDLNDWSKSYSHTSNLSFDTTNASYLFGDTSRAYRTSATNEEIVWQYTGMSSFQATTYFWPGEAVSPFSIYTSADDSNWTLVTPSISVTSGGGNGNWDRYVYDLAGLSNVNYVKIRWNNTSGQFWNPQVGQVTLTA
jgi:hypothetical protein